MFELDCVRLALVAVFAIFVVQCQNVPEVQSTGRATSPPASIKSRSIVNDVQQVPISVNTSALPRYNRIEGRVIVPAELPLTKDWPVDTRILVNHGEYLGFLK